MTNKLLQDALADAKAVKKTALANARHALVESFQPTLQRMVSSKLAEEEGDDEFGEDAEFDIDINVGDDAADDMALNDEPIGDEGMDTEEPPMDDIGFEDEEMGGEEELPLDDEEDVAESIMREFEGGGEDELELEALLRELDGEEEVMEGEEDSWQDPVNDTDPTDDEILENFLDGIDDEEEEEPAPAPAMESRKLRTENKNLKKKLNEAYSVVTKLKTVLNEINLLNAKLMYNTKLQKQFVNLTESQRDRIINSLDRANTIREVKLVYTTVCESLNKKPSKSAAPLAPKKRMVEGFASKPTKSIKPQSQDFNFVPRWQILAGLKPLED